MNETNTAVPVPAMWCNQRQFSVDLECTGVWTEATRRWCNLRTGATSVLAAPLLVLVILIHSTFAADVLREKPMLI